MRGELAVPLMTASSSNKVQVARHHCAHPEVWGNDSTNPLGVGGKGAYGCINPIGGDINIKLAKSVRDDGKLLLFANLGSNLFQVQSLEVTRGIAEHWPCGSIPSCSSAAQPTKSCGI